MKNISPPKDFSEFREMSRSLIAEEIPPTEIDFCVSSDSFIKIQKYQPQLVSSPFSSPIKVSKKQLYWMKNISMFRSDDTWNLLYRLLWKIRGNQRILENPADPDVIEAERRAKQVSRDIHKMHAFVRFKKIDVDKREYFIAWHKPQHKTLRAGAVFFKHRFGAMRWSILTPDESAHWNLETLSFTPGVETQPTFSDSVESDWLTYYESIFNPARIKVKAMKKEMPVRYWESMPETKIISRLLAEAPSRVDQMKVTAQPKVSVPLHECLSDLKAFCCECKSCPIACLGGKAVFGEGPENAHVVLVGEQPGDEEDTSGKPFVGPAGELLNRVLHSCQIDRSNLYITNAVKHFKWISRGKHRLHQRPNGSEILACKPWLNAELELIKPNFIICLGATAAQSVLGIKIGITESLEKIFSGPNNAKVLVTYHPSAALRASSDEKREEILAAIRYSLLRINLT